MATHARRALALAFLFGSPQAHAEPSHTLAAGVSAAWQVRKEYGSRSLHQFAPEALVQGYVPLAGPLWVRPELRAGYSTQLPDMPRALRVEERDLALGAAAGILFDWYVVPVASVGYELIARTIRLESSGGVSLSRSHIARGQRLSAYTAQVGVGLPAADGFLVLEPWLRYTWCPQDSRLGVGYGLDLSLSVF